LVRGLLWEWIDELDDPDPEQRASKMHYVEGMLNGAQAAGLLGAEELAAFAASHRPASSRLLSATAPPPRRISKR
jgi:hypothetical protein